MRMFRADRLREARLSRGLTQDELASRAGIGQAGINRYENGKTSPPPDILGSLAQALEVSADWLLGLTDTPHGHVTTAELTAAEWQALLAFRSEDLEELVRLFLERKQQQSGNGMPVTSDE